MAAFLLVFIAYRDYELVVAFTWGIALPTAFDNFIVQLTLHEYRTRRANDPLNDPAHQA